MYVNANEKAIDIGRLQSFATRQAMDAETPLFSSGADTGFKVAIIGAGPAGISAACELRALGHQVDVFEAKTAPSGLTLYGVAPYKITNEEALQEMDYLQSQFGYSVLYNRPISTREDLELLENSYDAIFLGIGLGATSRLALPGEEREGCIGAVEFIEQLRMGKHSVEGAKKVIVLGGGNTAMDAASESARLGADHVILAYRRGKGRNGRVCLRIRSGQRRGCPGPLQRSAGRDTGQR